LRWRPGAGQHIIFVSDWSIATDRQIALASQAEQASQEEQPDRQEGTEAVPEREAQPAADPLPPVEMLRVVAERWARMTGDDEGERPALLSFRAPGVVSPAELTSWLPGAAARLYTLGGRVAPLPDTALSEPPLARYSVVRAPNMSFWPHLRALIEEQEREEPGMELWENLDDDLALLEQELAWWIASPQGLILNLYEGEALAGHLSLARQYDAAEGCNGWGIIALHVAPWARGQRLGMLLQRVAATLIATRQAARRGESASAAAAPGDPSQTRRIAALNTQHWPYLFGFVAAQNIPALRGAYRAGRRIIGTYVDVPIEALQSAARAGQPTDSAEG
jgi:hypothetical protein